MSFNLKITALGTCNTGDKVRLKGFPEHNRTSYEYIKDLGFNALSYGYLDNWDPHFSQFDFFGISKTFHDLIPYDYKERNREELTRRLKIAHDAGLKVYLSTEGPISRKILIDGPPANVVPGGFWRKGHEKFDPFFGTGGDRYGGGRPTVCLGQKEVRTYYRELMTDIVSSFPEIAGFTFFGGDSYSTLCDERCPRCGSKPAWLRYVKWVEELARTGQKQNPDLMFYIRNWPWWNECFDMVERIESKSVGIICTPSWGFRFGQTGEKNPKLTDKWWCLDPQSGTMPLETGELKGSISSLNQPWANVISPSDKFCRLAKIAKDKGLSFVCWDERVTAETLWPYHLPSPLTPILKLRHLIDSGIDGIEEFWGLTREELTGERTNINSLAFKAVLEDSSRSNEEILTDLAGQVYGEQTVRPALEAWHAVIRALSRWTVIAWRQRMHVMVRGGMNPYYLLDLTKIDDLQDFGEVDHLGIGRDVWEKYAENLEEVIEGLDTAIGAYEEVTAEARDEGTRACALFDSHCLQLGRNVLASSRLTCFAHMARIRGKAIPGKVLKAAVKELKLFLELNETIDVYIIDKTVYEKAIRSMELKAPVWKPHE